MIQWSPNSKSKQCRAISGRPNLDLFLRKREFSNHLNWIPPQVGEAQLVSPFPTGDHHRPACKESDPTSTYQSSSVETFFSQILDGPRIASVAAFGPLLDWRIVCWLDGCHQSRPRELMMLGCLCHFCWFKSVQAPAPAIFELYYPVALILPFIYHGPWVGCCWSEPLIRKALRQPLENIAGHRGVSLVPDSVDSQISTSMLMDPWRRRDWFDLEVKLWPKRLV